MNWFYVDAGQQAGPVTDEQLDELVRSGKVRGTTLVWREGLANWQPYFQARPEGVQPAAPPPPPMVAAASPLGGPAPGYPPAAMPGMAVGMAYAGFWLRFVAKLIDYVIIRIVTIPLEFLPIGFMSTLPSDPSKWVEVLTPGVMFSTMMPLFLISVAIWVLYIGLFVGKFGATPGKMALGLKIVSEDGSSIAYGRAFARALAEIPSMAMCFIGYIMAGFDAKKRALHDHITNTRVIRTRF